ncbi:fasciclin domain-containing protein [Arcticibacter sp.]|uniref:fasciclin domain-containing protein n=1 Tax=Arcticibacter sp. TaxID=1872630 RepID=UPI00389054A3
MKKVSNVLSRNIIGMICMIFIFAVGCKKENILYNTTEDVNITGYLDRYPEDFSEFRKILDLTKNASFLGAYGAYTVFAPTNDAIALYLKEKGVASVEAIDVQELNNLVRYHVLEDTIRTTQFTDGKLSRLTMYGQYLITGASNVGGVSKITVNRQANIINSNISLGNGIIHSIDHVLQPASLTVAQMVENDPKFSIFTQLLKATSLYDSLNILPANNPNPDSTRRWMTLLAEPDDVFAEAGISSYEALKARYSNTGNPANHADSLYLYAAYHILPDAKYIADIVTATSHTTLAPFEVITSKEINQEILINDDEFNGVHEPGAELVRGASDKSASNGVVHSMNAVFSMKVRNPTAVYFDVADQPEFKKLPGYRLGSVSVKGITDVAGIRFESGYSLIYEANAGTGHYWGDRISLPMAAAATTKRSHWIEFTTPMLVKGSYKVWVCYRTNGKAPLLQGYFNGVPLARILNMAEYNLKNTPDSEMETLGYKYHTNNTSSNSFVSRYIGTVTVATTDRQILRFEGVGTSGGADTWWDMIHFIPVDQEQLWPRFHQDGSIIPKPQL